MMEILFQAGLLQHLFGYLNEKECLALCKTCKSFYGMKTNLHKFFQSPFANMIARNEGKNVVSCKFQVEEEEGGYVLEGFQRVGAEDRWDVFRDFATVDQWAAQLRADYSPSTLLPLSIMVPMCCKKKKRVSVFKIKFFQSHYPRSYSGGIAHIVSFNVLSIQSFF